MDEDKKDYSFYDYLAIILKHKKKILISTLIVGLLTTIIVFFIMDLIYLSTCTVQSSRSTGGLSALLSGGGLSDLGSLTELGGSSSSKELAVYEEILMSRRCIEETIIKFNLMEEYDSKYMQDAVKFFRENIMELDVNKKAGILEIGIFDKSPVKAQEINSFLIFQLNKIYTELKVQDAKNNREYLEERYKLIKEDLRKAEDNLMIYQEIYGVAPDMQVLAAAKTEIELEAEIASEEIKLDLLQKILTPDQAEIKTQKEKINALNKQLFNMRNSSDDNNKLKLKGAPKIVINFLRLKRDIEIQSKILSTILPLYEQAKIEENKETPTVLVLDEPNVPDRKKKPKRLTSVLVSLFISFFVFSITAILYDIFFWKLKILWKESGKKFKV